MAPPLLFVSLNYSMGRNSSIHLKLPPNTNGSIIRNVPAGISLFVEVSVFNELQESKNNPTSDKGAVHI